MDPEKTPWPGPLPDRQLRRFFAGPEQFQGEEVILSLAETRHLLRVLRLPVGERVEVADGRGRVFAAEICRLEPSAARLRLLGEMPASPESPLQITLGLALSRAETFDLVVRQVTEMGIFRLIPFYCARTLVKPWTWKKTRHSRWLRVSQEALKSSQRIVLPEISGPVEFSRVLEGAEEVKVLFWEHHQELDGRVDLAALPRPASVRALIGPEGGFTAAEAAAAREAGFLLLGLGPRRLRVETAALAGVSVLQYLWGDLGS